MLGSVISAILGLIPDFPVPDWLSSAGGFVGTVTSALSGSSAWLPWSTLILAVGLVMAAYAAAVVIRGVRIALSFLTLGGGS